MKPAMMLKWEDEAGARPISRDLASRMIRGNRRAKHPRITVARRAGQTLIAGGILGVACVIYRAEGGAA